MTITERLGMLFILVGPGGSGKNALMNFVLERLSDVSQLPTATTRPPRDDEEHGVQHLFMDVEAFRQMIADGELLEHQEVHPGRFYGVPRTTLDTAIHDRRDLMADIEFKGATIIRAAYPDNTLTIFVAPPSIDILRERLIGRQDSASDVEDRLDRMSAEMLYAPTCDHIIVNDDFDRAAIELLSISQALRGQTPEVSFPLHVVRFHVEVYPCYNGGVFLPTNNGGQPLQGILRDGETPALAAQRILATYWPHEIDVKQLVYAAPDDGLPVDFYVDDEQTYHVYYRFVYEMDETLDTPGFQSHPIEAII